MNAFAQGFIDARQLLRVSTSFLGEGTELMVAFESILGLSPSISGARVAPWADREGDGWVRMRMSGGKVPGVLDRPSQAELNVRYGSYRKLPATVRHFAPLLSQLKDMSFIGSKCDVFRARRDVSIGPE